LTAVLASDSDWRLRQTDSPGQQQSFSDGAGKQTMAADVQLEPIPGVDVPTLAQLSL
jgi:hypothetical protein